METTDLKLKIKNLCYNKKITIKELCKQIDMTEQGFSFSIKNETLSFSKIKRIVAALNIPILDFFTEQQIKEEKQSITNEIVQCKSFGETDYGKEKFNDWAFNNHINPSDIINIHFGDYKMYVFYKSSYNS